MPDGPGPIKVRNQAFRLVAEVLDLPGGVDSLQFIDLDRASPVFDLAPVVEAGIGFRVIYRVLDSLSSGSTGTLTADFWDGTSWDSVFSPESGDQVPPEDWPVLITQIGALYPGAADGFDAMLVRLRRTGVTPVEIPIWFADEEGPGGSVVASTVSTPWMRPPPMYVEQRTFPEIQFLGEQSSGSPVSMRYYVEVFTAPEGTFRNSL